MNWISAALALVIAGLCAILGSISGLILFSAGSAFWALQATLSPVSGEALPTSTKLIIRRVFRLLRFS